LTKGSKKRVLKAGDWVLFLVGGVLVVFVFYNDSLYAPAGKEVVITAGSSTAAYDLGVDRTVLVEGPLGQTEIVIAGGRVWVEDSPCRDKICVQMGKKKRTGEQIVCLPNRVVVEVVGDEFEFDAVSR
jgi:hypothetical protein